MSLRAPDPRSTLTCHPAGSAARGGKLTTLLTSLPGITGRYGVGKRKGRQGQRDAEGQEGGGRKWVENEPLSLCISTAISAVCFFAKFSSDIVTVQRP